MRLAWWISLATLLPVLPLSAQLSGRISGSVVDSTGAAVPGAVVNVILSGGAKPLLSAATSADGVYRFIGVRPAEYDVSIEAKGFLKTTVRGIMVDAARETSVPVVKLQLAAVSQSVDVTADVQGVATTNAEIAGTISTEMIQNLPLLDRDVLSVIQTQAGVASNGNSTTVINGLRTSYSNVTLDGVNVQDNYIRDNALDYLPNKLFVGQVSQMSLVSANANSAASGGATQTAMTTPSGNNQVHGTLLWYNRNSHFSANNWFNNRDNVNKTFLNQNQGGASIGGAIKKDKLFYYANYELLRAHQQFSRVGLVLTDSARAGVFNYVAGGELRTVNLMALRGLSRVDPVIQELIDLTPSPTRINTSDVGDFRNFGGYRFNQRDNATRDNITGKIDFNANTRHAFSGTYIHDRDNSDRPDAANALALIPKVYNWNHTDLIAASWRWTPSATLTNELAGGANLDYGYFNNLEAPRPFLVTGLAFSNPVNQSQTQGRETNTVNIHDDAQWQRGRHYIQFGFDTKRITVQTYDEASTVATYALGMGFGQPALVRSNLPGITTNDLAAANSLLATLGGYIDAYAQTFNVTSRSSGFVTGAPYLRNLLLNDYGFYLQDKWRMLPRLTVTLGLRYELPGVVDERDSLELMPVIQGSVVSTLLSDATLDFAGKSAGRPWYKRPKKSFAPNLGFAWDVFGNGRTALRGSYSINYANDQELLAAESMVNNNGGLQGNVAKTGLSTRFATGAPPIPVPKFILPRKASDNYALDHFAPLATIDPNLHRTYVQQYSFGIQHEWKGTIFDARYVGNHVVGAYRSFDFNQVQIQQNGFLPDFLRAQNNGFLAEGRTGVFNPNYNAAIPGSQPLTVFPRMPGGGYLSDPDVQYYLQTGEPGELATLYQTNDLQGPVSFFPSQYALGADMLTNYSSSSYNSLQLEARHRLHAGLTFQANYTYSKVLSDADGDLQSRFQPFLDINNTKLERSRANFDLTHMIKANGVYELPFGKDHRLNYRPLERLVGGWRLSGSMIWQSGAPFSILSGRGTLNRANRSYYNTASTSLTASQLEDVVRFEMTGFGPNIIAKSARNQDDGTGVNIDGQPFFSDQVFYNPTAGNLGVLQRRRFSGPWTFNTDISIFKAIRINERHHAELRMDAFNVLNHATFWIGDQNINSPSFGSIFYTFYPARILQFGLTYKF